MTNCELYIFDKNNKLIGGQNVSNNTVGEVTAMIEALKTIDRTGIVSDKGRSVCCVCSLDLGECEIKAGDISHGYCKECFEVSCREIENLR